MARAVCQGAKTAKRYAALGAGMKVDAQGYGREPTAMVRGVLSCLFVCLFPNTTQWPIVFVPEGQWRGRGGPPDRGRRGQRVLRGQRVSRGISRLRRQRRPFFFTRNGVFWDACWSWLGARPRTVLWQTGGNGTHAVRSAVGRAVGRTAHTGGAGLWNRRQAHGVLAVTGSIPLGGSPRLLSVARALLPNRVFYLEGGEREPV